MASRRGRRWLVGALVVLLLGSAALGPGVTQASPVRQGGALRLFDEVPQTGLLDGNTAELSFAFPCPSGAVRSIQVTTISGNLVTDVTIVSDANNIIAVGTQANQNPNVTIAEAFTNRSTAPDPMCTAQVRRAGQTSGVFEIRLLAGFAYLDKYDKFAGPRPPLSMLWTPYTSENMSGQLVDEQYQINILVDNLIGYIAPEGSDSWSDLYAQIDAQVVGAPSYVEWGLVLREDIQAELFYVVTVSSDQDWSVYYFNGDWQQIQPWTVSPVLTNAGQGGTLGVFLQGNAMKVYYNHELVGEVLDLGNYASEGQLSIAASTGPDQTDTVTVLFDNLIITEPYPAGQVTGLPTPAPTEDGSLPGLTGLLATATALAMQSGEPTPDSGQPVATPTSGLIVPTSTPRPTPFVVPSSTPEPVVGLTTWESSQPSVIVTELRQLGVVPFGGSVALNVPTSFGDTSTSGFSFYPLGQGRTFRNFVLSFDATLDITGPGSGCGMHFRDGGSSTSMALVFEDGAGLLAQMNNEDFHPASVFDVFPAITAGQGAVNRVIVTAVEQDLRMYVNGQLVAQGQFNSQSGTVALEVFVNEDDAGATQRTYCELNNIWLWEF